MPSAANVKVEKQINSESALVDNSTQNTPIRQALVIIEHKIRNLEKRKAKLESYRELQSSGKELNSDQRIAVAKYDEVVQTLEFARDLCKQFNGIATFAEKEAKKVARKEAVARSQQELAKVRELLLVQDALTQLGNDSVREDFLVGKNGAVALAEEDLKLMDDLYTEIVPKHEAGAPAEFTTQVQTAAEHLLAVVDGKQKEIFGSTYSHIKEVIGKIHESGYFDQSPADNNVPEFTEEVSEPAPIEAPIHQVESLPGAPVVNDGLAIEGVPVYLNVESLAQEEVPPPIVPAQPVLEQPAQPPQQQYFQQPRPISEVLGTAPFFFLQDSELDSPEQTPPNPVLGTATIPSQTFTNQNFVSMAEPVNVARQNTMTAFAPPNPPPPIPMPPSHLPSLEQFVGHVPMQPYTAYQQQSAVPEPEPAHQVHEPPAPVVARNGTEEVRDQLMKPNDEENGSPRNGPRGGRGDQAHGGPQQQRPGSREHPHQQSKGGRGQGDRPGQQGGYHPHQTYYQNNNGYASNANRQRPSRGGQRQGGGRPGPPQHKLKPQH